MHIHVEKQTKIPNVIKYRIQYITDVYKIIGENHIENWMCSAMLRDVFANIESNKFNWNSKYYQSTTEFIRQFYFFYVTQLFV